MANKLRVLRNCCKSWDRIRRGEVKKAKIKFLSEIEKLESLRDLGVSTDQTKA